MIDNSGWIKLHRKITEWDWYQDQNTFRVFLHILLCARATETSWRGRKILPGQFITGRKSLSQKLKISEQSIRTSINRLKSTNEITIESTNEYSIITLNNWESYQQTNQQTNKRLTNDQPATNQRLTTNKEVKNKRKKEVKNKFIPPTFEEFSEWIKTCGHSLDAEHIFKYYDDAGWKDSKGKQVLDWKQKVRGVWCKDENKIKITSTSW